jgi:hypothetical protein
MGHPEYRYTPWSEERRRAASERAKARIAAQRTGAVNADWPMTENVSHFRAPRRTRERWSPEERVELEKMWNAGMSADAIADVLGKKGPSSIYGKVHQMGLPPRRGGGTGRKRWQRPPSDREAKQRRFTGIVNHDGPRVDLPPHHPALREGATIFPSTVVPAAHVERLLKSGENSRKIGKQMVKGRWSGMPLYTLTLEERETCPRTCLQWATCYGNNMHMAHRIHDDGTLTLRLTSELLHLAFIHPKGFIVRLHVLGDFYSVAYVGFWREMLERFPNLRIFGFTARLPSDPIGRAVLELMRDFYDRVAMRISGGGYPTDCAEVVDAPEQATGIRCPAETDATRCCANCGLCMQTNRTITFVRH